ncbi:MAG: hypothetical protein ABI488_14265 [Polyangiaceae bacterium]
MSEFRCLLDESSEADEFERAILRSGSIADPTDAKRDEVWSNVLGTLALAPLAPLAVSGSAAKAAASGAGKVSAVSLGIGKGFVVGLALYGAAAGVSELARRLGARPAPVVGAPRVVAAPTQHALPAVVASPPLGAKVAAADPAFPTAMPSAAPGPSNALSGAAPVEPAAPSPVNDLPSVAAFAATEAAPNTSGVRESQLKAEAAALSRAREALRAGRLTDAFAQLEASRRQFSAPELYQEREALTIELLSRSGQAAVAEQRAAAFLRRFPESPHADQMRRFVAR